MLGFELGQNPGANDFLFRFRQLRQFLDSLFEYLAHVAILTLRVQTARPREVQ